MQTQIESENSNDVITPENNNLFLVASAPVAPVFLTIETPQGEYTARKFVLPDDGHTVYVLTYGDVDKETGKVELFQCVGDSVAAALIQTHLFCKEAIETEGKKIKPFELPDVLKQFVPKLPEVLKQLAHCTN